MNGLFYIVFFSRLSCDPYCKDGMIRVEGCSGGAPIVMSAPHFLHGDPELWEAVDGLDPVNSLHDTFMHVEIMSGVPFSAHKRIQVGQSTSEPQTHALLLHTVLYHKYRTHSLYLRSA